MPNGLIKGKDSNNFLPIETGLVINIKILVQEHGIMTLCLQSRKYGKISNIDSFVTIHKNVVVQFLNLEYLCLIGSEIN